MLIFYHLSTHFFMIDRWLAIIRGERFSSDQPYGYNIPSSNNFFIHGGCGFGHPEEKRSKSRI